MSQNRDKGEDTDLFDTESEMFSALDQSETESSINFGSREDSPEPIFTEKDVDDSLDVNMISLMQQNTDF